MEPIEKLQRMIADRDKEIEGMKRILESQKRVIRQLQDEQAEYSETAMYARIHELEAKVEGYEKQIAAIKAVVYREIG